MEDKMAKWSFDGQFLSYMEIFYGYWTSTILQKFDSKNKHCLLIVSILINNRIRPLEVALIIGKHEQYPLSRNNFHFLIGLYRQFYDIFCQHLTIDNFGFHGF